jgi:NitT/TauT family transport system permease protein/sulfonate transport system permease protein
LLPAAGLIIVLGAWELLSRTHLTNQLILPSPEFVFKAGVQEAATGVLLPDVLVSLQRVLVGYVLAVVVGVGLGLVIGWNNVLYRMFNPVVEAVRPIPAIAWIPLAILWFGLTNNAAYYIVFIGPVFPIFVTTVVAVRSTGQHYVNAALCLGATDWAMLRSIIFPGALPEIFTVLRVGIAMAWTDVVAAELVAAQSGLGYQMWQARELFESNHVIFGMLMIGFLGFACNYAVLVIERRVLRWHYATAAR